VARLATATIKIDLGDMCSPEILGEG